MNDSRLCPFTLCADKGNNCLRDCRYTFLGMVNHLIESHGFSKESSVMVVSTYWPFAS